MPKNVLTNHAIYYTYFGCEGVYVTGIIGQHIRCTLEFMYEFNAEYILSIFNRRCTRERSFILYCFYCALGRILLRFGLNVFLIETQYTVPLAINQPHRIQTENVAFCTIKYARKHATPHIHRNPDTQWSLKYTQLCRRSQESENNRKKNKHTKTTTTVYDRWVFSRRSRFGCGKMDFISFYHVCHDEPTWFDLALTGLLRRKCGTHVWHMQFFRDARMSVFFCCSSVRVLSAVVPLSDIIFVHFGLRMQMVWPLENACDSVQLAWAANDVDHKRLIRLYEQSHSQTLAHSDTHE